MAPKHHHPAPLSGGDRKALKKELVKSRAMTRIFAERSAEKRREGEALIREADNLACQSWNEKMWSDGGPIDPSPTIDQAINGGFPWLEIKCSRLQDAARSEIVRRLVVRYQLRYLATYLVRSPMLRGWKNEKAAFDIGMHPSDRVCYHVFPCMGTGTDRQSLHGGVASGQSWLSG
jgi:hypothetical protein